MNECKLKVFIVSIFFLLFFQGFVKAQSGTIVIPAAADKLENPLQQDPATIKSAFKTYKKVCWVCHGDNGVGNGPESLDLEIKPADFNAQEVLDRSDGALFWWIREGGNGMQPYKDVLNSQQIWELVIYVRYVQETY